MCFQYLWLLREPAAAFGYKAPFSSGQLCCCGYRTGGTLGDVHLISRGQVICLASTDLATLPFPQKCLARVAGPCLAFGLPRNKSWVCVVVAAPQGTKPPQWLVLNFSAPVHCLFLKKNFSALSSFLPHLHSAHS